jgi:hypothetical protein
LVGQHHDRERGILGAERVEHLEPASIRKHVIDDGE